MSFTRDIPTPKPGDEIAAADIATLVYEIRRCQLIAGSGILVNVGPVGTRVDVSRNVLTNIRTVYTQSAGIGFATTATVGTVVTLTPGSAVCWDSFYNADNKSVVDTSTTPGLTVYNDYTSVSSHQNAGVGGQWVMVGDAANGTTRLIGDPCA